MAKKLILLAMAIGAIAALAAPAMAGASQITFPAGTAAPVGTVITGTSSNTVTVTPLGNLTCASVVVKATITKNSGGTAAAKAEAGASSSSTCFLGKNAISVTNITLKSLESTTSGVGKAVLSFEADLPGGLTCHFESAGAANNVSYTAGTSNLHLAGGLVGSPEICGEEGEVSISGDFALTAESSAVVLD
jgi:hypothetical protein